MNIINYNIIFFQVCYLTLHLPTGSVVWNSVTDLEPRLSNSAVHLTSGFNSQHDKMTAGEDVGAEANRMCALVKVF